MASALTFVLYGATGNKLEAAIIFPALAYFTVLRTPLMILPSVYTVTVDAHIALKRIQTFLLAEDASPIPPPEPSHEYALSMDNASFVWDQLSSDSESSDTLVPAKPNLSDTDGKPKKPTKSANEEETAAYLNKINLKIPRGALVAVVGPVGSGKSSLLQAMIGNMTLTDGHVVRGTNISYASQTAWIQNATIRDNILFDTPYDEERYHRVVKACSLEADLKLFPFGDETEIGERGVNMSGGQKARLSLARSVYFNAGTVIMDDPLSAVDPHVGKRLWQDCVLTELKGRTRIIATHQLHVLVDVDYVVCLKNGQIAEEGTYNDLIAQDGEFCALMAQYGGVQAEEDEDVNFDDIQPDRSNKQEKVLSVDEKSKAEIYDKEADAIGRKSLEKKTETAQKLMSSEERESGAVSGNVYGGYLKASGAYLWAITFALFALQQLANIM